MNRSDAIAKEGCNGVRVFCGGRRRGGRRLRVASCGRTHWIHELFDTETHTAAHRGVKVKLFGGFLEDRNGFFALFVFCGCVDRV
jgi:hypothetical protein